MYRHPLRAKWTSAPLFLRQIQLQYLIGTINEETSAPETRDRPTKRVQKAILNAIVHAYPHLVGVHDTPPVSEPNPPLLTKTQVKEERGWTDGLLKRFMPEPDFLKANPRYKNGAPLQLFVLPRVETIESSAEFQAAFAGVKKRRPAAQDSARKAVETKRQQMQIYVESLKITVPVMPRKRLRQYAISSYNAWQSERSRGAFGLFASESSGSEFLSRISVNFVRHEMTEYEVGLYTIFGRVGTSEGYRALALKVYAAIAQAYPDLAAECRRQAEEKGLGWPVGLVSMEQFSIPTGPVA